MPDDIHVGDIGTRFIVTIEEDGSFVDISTASVKEIFLKARNGLLKTFTAGFISDGTDGKIFYDTLTGDLDEEGSWTIQARVVFSGGDWKSKKKGFFVHGNLT